MIHTSLKYRLFSATAFCLYSANCDRECRKYHRDTASCLASIRARATDAGLWWYGDTNVERCPPGDGSIECFNPRGLFGESLMSAVFGKDNFNIDQIDRYIDINFESEPGQHLFIFLIILIIYFEMSFATWCYQ